MDNDEKLEFLRTASDALARAVSGIQSEADGSVLRTASEALSEGRAAVSESLVGLVGAVDELKKTVGMGEAVDFAAIEEFIKRLQQENEEFRQFAEQAIVSAQRLKEERDELQQRLEQTQLERTMGDALAQTQKLRDVADEFEKDLYAQKLAEAEARVAEVEGLRERIAELEDENAGLTQTLNEFRQTSQQLQKLQSHEVKRLQAMERGAGGSRSTPRGAAVTAAVAAVEASASGTSSPDVVPMSAVAPLAFRLAMTPTGSPRVGDASLALAAGGAELAPPPLSARGTEAVHIAEQLEEVTGEADSGGLLASAATALREMSSREAELLVQQQDYNKLKAEVEELNDTMFSKTFKPPSAWAEREIKYKSEKKYWEEQQKELQARLAGLLGEVEAYKGTSKAHQLEERIQDLEAQLLQSEREKTSVRSQLHELQLSLRTTGEFGNAGKLISPRVDKGIDEGHEVAQLVDHLEHGGPAVRTATDPAQRLQGLESQLQAVAAENTLLRQKVLEQQTVEVPASLKDKLGQVATGGAVLSVVASLEARLRQVEGDSQALAVQMGSSKAALAAAHNSGQEGEEGNQEAEAVALAAEAEMQLQELEVRAQQAEAAGDTAEAASLRQQADGLRHMQLRLRQAEEQREVLQQQVADVVPAATQQLEGAGDDDEVAVPEGLQAELGAKAAASAVQAKVTQLEQRLTDAKEDTVQAQRQLRAAVLLEQQVQQAAMQQRVLSAQVEAGGGAGAGAAGGGADGGSEALVSLLRQLSAVTAQKEAAQGQLWQLTELQDQLQEAEAARRRLQVALQHAEPALTGDGGGDGEQQEEGQESGQLASLRAELAAAQRRSSQLRAQLQALTGGEEGDVSERWQKAEAEAAQLRQQLADLQPVRMQLQLHLREILASGGDAPAAAAAAAASSVDFSFSRPSSAATTGAGTAAGGSRRVTMRSPEASPAAAGAAVAGGSEVPGVLAREASDSSLATYTSEQARALSRERAAADAAWREHQKSSEVAGLLRAKAELETRCEMLETQLAKMQTELEHADETNAVFENHLDYSIRTGDVSTLSSLREKLQSGRHSLSKRMFRRSAKSPSPSKETLKNTVHEMQDALTSSEEEKNALRRQLAKLSKKYQQVTQQAAHTAGIVAGAQAMQGLQRRSTDSMGDGEATSPAPDVDTEMEMHSIRQENEMLMEHVVMVKVRHAEMEGEYLEAKRQLLRMREKNMQLSKKMAELRDAAERGAPLPLTPRAPAASPTPGQNTLAGAAGQEAPASAASAGAAATTTPRTEKKGGMSLGGLRLPTFA